MKIVDEDKKLDYEGDDAYAIVISSRNGVRFAADVANGAELTSVSASFLASVIKGMVDSGLTKDEAIRCMHLVIDKVGESFDIIQENTHAVDKDEKETVVFDPEKCSHICMEPKVDKE